MTQQPSKRARPSPTIRVGVLGLFAAFLLVLPLALAPRAEAYIYWTDIRHGRSGGPTSTAPASSRRFITDPGARLEIDRRREAYLLDPEDGPATVRPRQDRRHEYRPELHHPPHSSVFLSELRWPLVRPSG